MIFKREAKMTTNNYRILVIDDVALIHDDYRKILLPSKAMPRQYLDEINEALFGINPLGSNRLPPFEIDFAFQGQEGVDFVQKSLVNDKPYAVSFVDVQMPPGEDGIETIKKIWQIDSEIQTVICTAYAKYSWEDLRLQFGENDRLFIVKKPFDNLEIMQLACTLAKKWSLNRILHEELARLKKLPLPPQQKNETEITINSMKEAIQSLAAINTKFTTKPRT
jgi:CheY-like chemotaxis protein